MPRHESMNNELGTLCTHRFSQPFLKRLMPYETSELSFHLHREDLLNLSIRPSYGRLKVAPTTYLLRTPLTSFLVLNNCYQRLQRGALCHTRTHMNHPLPSLATIPLPPPRTLTPGTSMPHNKSMNNELGTLLTYIFS